MGFFDILKCTVKCSKCGKKRKWEIQIKTFVKECRRFDDYPFYHNVGDEVIVHDDIISGYGCCPICNTHRDILVKVIDGKISNEYKFDDKLELKNTRLS